MMSLEWSLARLVREIIPNGPMIYKSYPLVMTNIAIENGPFIVDYTH